MKNEDLRNEFRATLSKEEILFLTDEDYILWLEKKIIEKTTPPIVVWIDKMFQYAVKREWYETYFFIDLHQTVIKPNYVRHSSEMEFYPYAKETLQLLTNRDDIILVLYTSSYPEQVKEILNKFEKEKIHFNFVNKNPDVLGKNFSFGYYEEKPYFNVLMDDKAGFSGDEDWKPLYDYFLTTQYRPKNEWRKL